MWLFAVAISLLGITSLAAVGADTLVYVSLSGVCQAARRFAILCRKRRAELLEHSTL